MTPRVQDKCFYFIFMCFDLPGSVVPWVLGRVDQMCFDLSMLFHGLWNCCQSEEWEQVSQLETVQVKNAVLLCLGNGRGTVALNTSPRFPRFLSADTKCVSI